MPAAASSGLSQGKGFPGAPTVENPPAMPETQAQSRSQEDPLEKGMATHSSILTWRIPWTEEPGGLQSTGSQRAAHNRATHTFPRECVLGLWVRAWLVFHRLI